MTTKILIGADIVPIGKNIELFAAGERAELIGADLEKIFDGADFICMNLEVPLTDKVTPIKKCGPNLIAPTKTIAGLKKINPYFFTLANNHIMDQGEQGLFSTMKLLSEAGISFAGVGKNLDEASQPFIVQIKNFRVGIFCCAEHEFSIAGKNSAGANPFDPLESFERVRELKNSCDRVIILFHGGKEHYRYPSPLLQKIFRKFAKSGADFVIAQHTHCIGCAEIFGNSHLIYGQGNFLFDHSKSNFWQTSLLIQLELSEAGDDVKYFPLRKTSEKVRLAKDADAEKILLDFQTRSREILQPDFVEERYKKFADEMAFDYFQRFSGRFGQSLFLRALRKFFYKNLFGLFQNEKSLLSIQNVLDCEAHRELATQALKSKIGESK